MRNPRSIAPMFVLALTLAATACGDDHHAPGSDGAIPDAATADAPSVDAAVPDGPADALDAADRDGPHAPVFRNPVALDDLPLAQQAAALLGVGPSKGCDACHGLTRNRLREWSWYTDRAVERCFTDVDPTTQEEARAIVDCLRVEPTGPFVPSAAGIYTTAARLPWFDYVFRLAFGAGADAELAQFVGRAAMPRGKGRSLDQGEVDVIAEWFARGLPQLEAVVPEDPLQPECQPLVTPAVGQHVAAMATTGWRALNRDRGLLMHGCAGAADPRGCLTMYPLSSTVAGAEGWTSAAPLSRIRVLLSHDHPSLYWTRSSADGRFIAAGGSADDLGTATFTDLGQHRLILADAFFDPGFFPDNSGFVMQGFAAHFCNMSLLTGATSHIAFTEPECADALTVGLYQQLGAAAGGDYWTVAGQYADDDPRGLRASDPSTEFDAESEIDLVPMIHDGSNYVEGELVSVPAPNEGDFTISPSSKLLLSRVGSSEGHVRGLRLRRLTATPSGGDWQLSVSEIGRYCVFGGKPTISYDERWAVYHHYLRGDEWQSLGYTGPEDPAFMALIENGTSNLYLLDLTTGVERRITTMGPGQYALFPHFRSDGWIYARVRDLLRGGEHVIASDAALLFER